MSANAPAGNENRNIGNIIAACTIATIAGDGASVVISHPAAKSCIQVPMLEMSVAVHSTAKVR
jgi:hypothetical protein